SQAFYAMQSPRQIGSRSPARAVGSGPYRLDSARPGRIELAANPQYWGGAPRLGRIVFRRLADQKSLEAALLAGELDVTSAVGLDRAAARRLLAQAGYPDGFDTTLMAVDAARPYLPSPLRLAGLVRDDLAQIGVRAKLEQARSWKEYLDRATRGDYALALLGWQADTIDPNDFLSALLATDPN